MKISICAGVAGVQSALALGALALGYPQVAGAFGAFALVQLISIAAQRCATDGVCDTRLVAPDVPRPPLRAAMRASKRGAAQS